MTAVFSYHVAVEQVKTEYGITLKKDKFECTTCQTCFERQLAFAKTELERMSIWQYMGVNVLQREMPAVKKLEAKYVEAAAGLRFVREKAQQRSLRQDVEMAEATAGASSRINELSDDNDCDDVSDSNFSSLSPSDSSSGDSGDEAKAGINHPVLKKIDELYEELGKIVGSGGVIPQGTVDAMKSIRTARYHIQRRKVVELEYRVQRRARREANTCKRRKLARTSTDPATTYNQWEYDEGRKLYPQIPDQSTPLPNAYPVTGGRNGFGMPKDFKWLPDNDDKRWHEHQVNDPRSRYYMTDEELNQIDFWDDIDYKVERGKREEWEYKLKKLEQKGRRRRELRWEEVYKPRGWSTQMRTRGEKRGINEFEEVNTNKNESIRAKTDTETTPGENGASAVNKPDKKNLGNLERGRERYMRQKIYRLNKAMNKMAIGDSANIEKANIDEQAETVQEGVAMGKTLQKKCFPTRKIASFGRRWEKPEKKEGEGKLRQEKASEQSGLADVQDTTEEDKNMKKEGGKRRKHVKFTHEVGLELTEEAEYDAATRAATAAAFATVGIADPTSERVRGTKVRFGEAAGQASKSAPVKTVARKKYWDGYDEEIEDEDKGYCGL
ncbi:hypothetical protein ABW20_dc0102106 [Dactylellina cionopaga]|nr:hypothetical protein ABW20_dc0102106 [Dactylellina cionopaga]